MPEPSSVCETCLEAASEEVLAEPDEVEMLCCFLGADIADHCCEEIETAGEIRCLCACHPAVKRELRASIRGAR